MFLIASLVGVVSLFMRSIDNAVCNVFPLGTHFMWHGFNSLLIYILMRQLIRNVNRRERMLREANIYLA
jgi:threonine/homoserine/homoserine lactone efflux protein